MLGTPDSDVSGVQCVLQVLFLRKDRVWRCFTAQNNVFFREILARATA